VRGPNRHLRLPSLAQLRQLQHRWHQVLVLSAVTGAATGALVAGFDWITAEVLLRHVEELPHLALAFAPVTGLIVATAALLWVGDGATPATSDEYLHAYHDRRALVNLREAPAKVLASIGTLGSGGALGFEGPSIYIGAATGSWLQRRFSRYFSRDDSKLLLVAGAAAGVAAIFKAPATGALFAVEVPYQEDTAAHAILPALVSSASSYLVFVAFHGTDPLFRISGQPDFGIADLAGAVGLGVLCGLGARAFVWVLQRAKKWSASAAVPVRLCVGGGGLALTAALGVWLFDGDPVTIGPGYNAIQWSLGKHAFTLILLLFVLHAFATACTILGGGAGGTFIPLVVQGWLLGRLATSALGSRTSLFPVLGAAAFLGAGYRTPLTGVVFVAESTGRPGFVVPALVATAISQLVMGRSSIAPYQRRRRPSALERRFDLPVTAALTEDPNISTPETTLDELVDRHFLTARANTIPVADDGTYLGMIRLDDVLRVGRPDRAHRTAIELVRTDAPVADAGWSLRDALRVMEGTGVDRLAVVDNERLVGVVTVSGIVRLDEILGDDTG
jgi:CIC family chloride channel protein